MKHIEHRQPFTRRQRYGLVRLTHLQPFPGKSLANQKTAAPFLSLFPVSNAFIQVHSAAKGDAPRSHHMNTDDSTETPDGGPDAVAKIRREGTASEDIKRACRNIPPKTQQAGHRSRTTGCPPSPPKKTGIVAASRSHKHISGFQYTEGTGSQTTNTRLPPRRARSSVVPPRNHSQKKDKKNSKTINGEYGVQKTQRMAPLLPLFLPRPTTKHAQSQKGRLKDTRKPPDSRLRFTPTPEHKPPENTPVSAPGPLRRGPP